MCKWNNSSVHDEFNQEDIVIGVNTHRITKISKNVAFQYRSIHHAVLLNDRMYHLKI